MGKKIIKVYLKPEDFKGNSYMDNKDCPLARAIKRKFKFDSVLVYPFDVDKEFGNSIFTLPDGFKFEDYNFVKEEYEKDPKMKKAQYFVRLQSV